MPTSKPKLSDTELLDRLDRGPGHLTGSAAGWSYYVPWGDFQGRFIRVVLRRAIAAESKAKEKGK